MEVGRKHQGNAKIKDEGLCFSVRGEKKKNFFAKNPALSGRSWALAVWAGSRLFPIWSFSNGLWKDSGNCLNLFLKKKSKPTNSMIA